jgi:hypothetical protein
MGGGFVALTAVDEAGHEGPISGAVPFTLVRPPMHEAPSAPHACGGSDGEPGYAAPADRRGLATVCVAWDPPAGAATQGALRYEVARALDRTIVAEDRKGWQVGRAGAGEIAAPPAARYSGHLESDGEVAANAAIKARVTGLPAGTAERAAELKGGVLIQDGRRWVVMAAAVASDSEDLELALRAPEAAETPAADLCEIEAPPDYGPALASDALLRDMGGRTANEGAFGLVTGVPVEATTFRDEIVGRGRSRFFYRVRAVDAAGNRSPWSSVSPPFHQVDPSAPKAPRILSVLPGDRTATLEWEHDPTGDEIAYEIHRATDAEELENLRGRQPQHLIVPSADRPGPVYLLSDEGLAGIARSERYHFRVVARKTVQRGSGAPLEIRAASSLASVWVFDTRPPTAPDLQPTRQRVGDVDTVTLEWTSADWARFAVKRRDAGAGSFRILAMELEPVSDPAGSGWRYHFTDEGVDATQPSVYRIVLTNRFSRKTESGSFRVPPS